MSDLIDRQALLKTLNENKIEFNSDINYFILSAPTVQPAPCEDAVNRSEIIRLILERGLYCDTQADREVSAEIIRQLPSAQPEIKPKEGRWSKSDDGYECSECDWYSLYDSPWCPWCGAKMKGEEE